MGQNAHRKYKEFKNEEEKFKKTPWKSSAAEVRAKELEWKLQEIADKEDFDRGYKLLSDYEY